MRKLVACLWRWRLTVIVLLIVVGGPAWLVSWLREQARASVAIGQLYQLYSRLERHKHLHGRYPPAVVTDDRGNPLHSWRTLLVETMSEGASGEGKKYPWHEPSEPWNSARNVEWAKGSGRGWGTAYSTRFNWDESELTNILAVVGPNTPWDPDYKPGLYPQILLVEVHNSGIHWMEPKDLSVSDAKGGLLELIGQRSALCLLSDGRIARLDRKGLYLFGADRYERGWAESQDGWTSTTDNANAMDGEKEGKRLTDD